MFIKLMWYLGLEANEMQFKTHFLFKTKNKWASLDSLY